MTTSPDSVRPAPALAALAIAIAVALLVAACIAWGRSTTPLGERHFAPERVWAARSAAGALAALAHAGLLGVALPAIYRRRPTYAALALIATLAAALAGVTAGALYAATGR